ncbi:MAG TPA: xanthine dehydrogenase family protein subunit M [Candidatus Acidoferrales bacterium]|nr:xanthine dehydrogenase family protein subunit M [Candidatus Acidoferrales bacterium]
MKSFQYLAPIAPFNYLRPNGLSELLDVLNEYGSKAKLIAGGTDLTIALKERMIHPEVIIDLNRVRKELTGIEVSKNTMKIGAMTTYTELETNPIVNQYARTLSEAASQVGTYQIRNLGTIGANLANGSPAADTAPPLIVLNAKVHLQSKQASRQMPVQDFITGVKRTAIRPDEIVTSVEIPIKEHVFSYWMRSAKRKENVISVVSVAAASEIQSDQFGESRIALGAVAPTPILARESSTKLTGSPINPETIESVSRLSAKESKPISDVRAGADYRRHLVYVLTKRTINKVLDLSRLN